MTHWKDLSPAEKRAAVKEQILAGKSFGEVAAELQATSRSAIAVVVKWLRDKGDLPRAATKEETGAAGGAVSRANSRKRKSQPAVGAEPEVASKRRPAEIIVLPREASPHVISAMVDAYIQTHGVRRFEQGVMEDLDYLRGYLARHGFEIAYTRAGRHPYTVRGGGGRPRSFDRAGLFEFVDGLRIADGKEPFLPRSA